VKCFTPVRYRRQSSDKPARYSDTSPAEASPIQTRDDVVGSLQNSSLPGSPALRPGSFTSPLLTDLYQFTMLEAYLREGMEETAAFEFTVRDLSADRGFPPRPARRRGKNRSGYP
jgi:hypothetical protein